MVTITINWAWIAIIVIALICIIRLSRLEDDMGDAIIGLIWILVCGIIIAIIGGIFIW